MSQVYLVNFTMNQQEHIRFMLYNLQRSARYSTFELIHF